MCGTHGECEKYLKILVEKLLGTRLLQRPTRKLENCIKMGEIESEDLGWI